MARSKLDLVELQVDMAIMGASTNISMWFSRVFYHFGKPCDHIKVVKYNDAHVVWGMTLVHLFVFFSFLSFFFIIFFQKKMYLHFKPPLTHEQSAARLLKCDNTHYEDSHHILSSGAQKSTFLFF